MWGRQGKKQNFHLNSICQLPVLTWPGLFPGLAPCAQQVPSSQITATFNFPWPTCPGTSKLPPVSRVSTEEFPVSEHYGKWGGHPNPGLCKMVGLFLLNRRCAEVEAWALEHWSGFPPPKQFLHCLSQDAFCGSPYCWSVAASQNLLKCRTPSPISDSVGGGAQECSFLK